MSKELEALKELKYVHDTECGEDKSVNERFALIETALKDYQLHKEILNDYGFTLVNFREACFLLAQFRGSGYTGIENKLKALKIIQEKEIDIPLFNDCSNYYEYNEYCAKKSQLTQEKFNLLKEVLK